MKWFLVKYPSDSVHKYQLMDDAAVKIVLKYNPTQQSTRISSDGNHRLFFTERTGLWNNKMIFKNEYGVETGKLIFERGHHAGSIDIGDKKYQFSINNSQVPELTINKRHIAKSLAVCDLAIEGLQLSNTITGQKESDLEIAGLIWGFCRYLVGKPELVPVTVS
jgi:hypothetical protein